MRHNQRDLEKDLRLSNDKIPGFSRSTLLKPTIYLFMFLLGGGIALLGNHWIPHNSPSQHPGTVPVSAPHHPMTPSNQSLPTATNSIAGVVKQVGSAVVRINSTRTVTNKLPCGIDTALPAIMKYSFSPCPSPIITFSFEDVPHSCWKCCNSRHGVLIFNF